MVDAIPRISERGVLIEKVADRTFIPSRVGNIIQKRKINGAAGTADPATGHSLTDASAPSAASKRVSLIRRTIAARTGAAGGRLLHQLLDLLSLISKNRILSISGTGLSINKTIPTFGKCLVALDTNINK